MNGTYSFSISSDSTSDSNMNDKYEPLKPSFYFGVLDYSLTNSDSYDIVLPQNMNIFNSAYTAIEHIDDPSLKAITRKLVNLMKKHLLADRDLFNSKLTELHVSESNEASALVEWNFEKFRIGFSLDIEESDSSYYIVQTDDNHGGIYSESFLMKKNYDEVVEKIMYFIKRNT